MIALRSVASRSSLTLLTTAALAYAGYSMLKSRRRGLPPAGPQKQDPEQLDKMLDTALEDSMDASDPPSTVQPEVRGV